MRVPIINLLACFILAVWGCNNPQTDAGAAKEEPIEIYKESGDLSLHFSCVHQYTVPYYGDVFFEKITDTLIQKRFDIGLSIVNNSEYPISIWLWTCSWQNNVIINNPYIFFDEFNCDRNFPTPHTIKPRDSLYLTGTLTRDLLFDNSCKNCISTDNVTVPTTKIGLVYIDTAMCKTIDQYERVIDDKSKWEKIIWSNPLYLNKK